jgi:hypothetical protein
VLLPRRLLLVAAGLVLALTAATPALADGDPASDMLIAQALFYPVDQTVSTQEVARVNALLASAARQKFPLKVAVIASAYDLGSVPSLFRHPQTYAKFLGEEDFYYWRDELLVVMPNGYGLYRSHGAVPKADAAIVAKLPVPGTTDGTELLTDAATAIEALAARRGLTLSDAGAKTSGSDKGQDRVEIGAGVLILALVGVGLRYALRRRRR